MWCRVHHVSLAAVACTAVGGSGVLPRCRILTVATEGGCKQGRPEAHAGTTEECSPDPWRPSSAGIPQLDQGVHHIPNVRCIAPRPGTAHIMLAPGVFAQGRATAHEVMVRRRQANRAARRGALTSFSGRSTPGALIQLMAARMFLPQSTPDMLVNYLSYY